MSKKIRKISNINIYVIYYGIFLFGAFLFIGGLYMYDKGVAITEQGFDGKGLEIAGIITIVLGLLFVVLSFMYSRTGAKVIRTNCPYCHGTGYIDEGIGKKARQEICPVCDGTGKMYDEATKHLEEVKKIEGEKKAIESDPSVKEEGTNDLG